MKTANPIWLAPSALLLAVSGCSLPSGPPLQTVSQVDLSRYTGLWYEIARYPNSFESGCEAVTAEYALLDNGRIQVVNTCRQNRVDGPKRDTVGTARVVDQETNAKLKVTFFPPFEGDYWIIELDDDYNWAVVGEPSRRLLWILSRTPTLDPTVLDGILARLPEKGYDPAKLIYTEQPPADES